MKIALLADIHSNKLALESVLDDICYSDVDKIIFLGDYIFGGTGSCEVVDIIRDFSSIDKIVIKGNIEDLIKPLEAGEDWLYPVNHKIYTDLGQERVEYLKSLRDEEFLVTEGIRIKLCHNPSKHNIFITNDKVNRENNVPDLRILELIANGMQEDICIFGHYHIYMEEVVNNKMFINPGSVGMPFDGDTRAHYMLLDVNKRSVEITKKSVKYDIDKVIEDIHNKSYKDKFPIWSEKLIRTLHTGHCYI